MKRVFIILGILLVIWPINAQPRFGGFIQNWTAYNLNDENDVFLLRNRFRLNSTITGDWARGYASIDFNDERQAGASRQEFGIRELYVDLYFDKLDLRFGKQQVIWGKADGVFINDIVNPLDLRYFLMQDFDDIRQGSVMIKVNAFINSWGLEGLFIPKFESWQFAEPGSPWEFYRPPGMAIELDSVTILPIAFNWLPQDMPESTLKNGEFGIKLFGFAFGTDLSLLYLNSFQDSPISRIDTAAFEVDFSTGIPVPQSGELTLNPYFEKTTMYGFNFSRPVGGLVVRGEIGYFDDYHFNLQPAFTPELLPQIIMGNIPELNNVITSDYVQAMVGLDISGPWGSSISTQYIRKQIMDYDPAILSNEEIEEMFSLLLSGTFWNEEVSVRSLTLYDNNHDSGLSRFIVGYKVADAVLLETGVDILWGESESFIGQFADNDNAYLKIIYSF